MRVRFGEFSIDTATRQLFRGTAVAHLSPKAFDFLRLLVEARPRAIAKAELLDRLWPGTYVSESNLPTLAAEVRGVLGDDAAAPRFIRTVPRYGYAFAEGTVEVDPPTAAAPRCWLVSGADRYPLFDGITVIGRQPGGGIWLDGPGVSRQHARIVVDGNATTIEDLDSKNGTFVGGTRINGPVALADRDPIIFGATTVTFRRPAAFAETETIHSSEAAPRRRPDRQ